MTSLRPSAYNQSERGDGGPFLIIESAEPEGEGVDVYFTDIPADQRKPDSPMERLLNVCSDRLTIWPLNIRPDREDYLLPKYGALERIVVSRKVPYPYELPTTTADVDALLEELPDGFAKDFRFGLGLLWEYRFICETVASLGDVHTLIIHKGDESKIDTPLFILGVKRFHSLRRELNSIAQRYQRDARKDKLFSAYQVLLHGADASRFPAKKKKLRPDALAEMTHGGRDHSILSKRDQRVVVRLVQDSVETLAGSEPKMLMALKSDIELVTLKQLIDRYQEMLEKGLSEGKWQNFFMENPFILSLAFAVPFMLVQGQAYAGGKRLDGRGGKYADFLWASVSTGNLALIEIKRPETELLCQKPYRGDDVYGPSSDLGGAIAQVLDQRFKLQGELPIIKNNMNRNDIHAFALRCIVIAGTTPQEHKQTKSFELVRNALSDVTVVTFDELATRLTEVYKALMPPTIENVDLF